MKRFIKNIIYLLIIVFFILANSSCEPTNYGHYKLNKVYIIQNSLSDSFNYKYDSLKFKIIHDTKPDLILYDEGSSGIYNISLIDYYKTINFFTVNDYSIVYKAGNNINNIINLIYCSNVHFRLPCIESLINYNSECLCYDCEQNKCFCRDTISFQNVDQFMQNVQCKRANPIELTLNTPPDSTVLFQIKAEIELLDGRQFTLYSEPVYIKP